MRSGDGKFGVTALNTPDQAPGIIQQVIDNLNSGNTDGQSFETDISTDEQASQLELSQTQDGHPIFNFAVARVRYRAITTQAQNVRVFFRLFQVATTSTEYQPATTYIRGGQGGVVIPLVGIENGEIVTIPFFAAPRVNTTAQRSTRNRIRKTYRRSRRTRAVRRFPRISAAGSTSIKTCRVSREHHVTTRPVQHARR